MRRLILWDIDHTLIDTGGVGREMYAQAFQEATGRVLEHRASITGSTEMRILDKTLELHGIEPTPQLRTAYAAALGRAYQAAADDLTRRGRALPGAAETLRRLLERGDIQTVFTGNLQSVARTKLRVFGLDGMLDLAVGAYAEDDDSRAQIAASAWARAESCYGQFDGVVLLGDTPADIVAGAEAGIQVVGVATGQSSEEQLADAGASVTVPGLGDIDLVLTAIDEALR